VNAEAKEVAAFGGYLNDKVADDFGSLELGVSETGEADGGFFALTIYGLAMGVVDHGDQFEFADIGGVIDVRDQFEFVGVDAKVEGVIAIALLAEPCVEVISANRRVVVGVFDFFSCRCRAGIEDDLGWFDGTHAHGGLHRNARAGSVMQDGKRRRILSLSLDALDGRVVRTTKVAVAILEASARVVRLNRELARLAIPVLISGRIGDRVEV